MNEFSFGNRFIVEPYMSDHQIKATSGAGYAMIQQKTNLVGLKLLVDFADFSNGERTFALRKDSTIWIREELLYSQPWAKAIYSCKGIEGKFIIVDRQFVEMVTPAQSMGEMAVSSAP